MDEEYIPHMTPTELNERIQHDRISFSQNRANLTPAQMTAVPGPQDDWSVKDLIAHITWWEKYVLRMVNDLTNGKKFAAINDYNAYNAETLTTSQQRSLEDVLGEFASHEATLLAVIGQLSETQINEIIIDDVPLLYKIIGNTFGHYAEHSPDLLGYIDSLEK